MNRCRNLTPAILKKYLCCTLFSLFVFSCEIDDNERGYKSLARDPYRRVQRQPNYVDQGITYNPYNAPPAASRTYYNPYNFRRPPSPYYGPNPYYDYDQYYVPPSQYYNTEPPVEINSINSNKS